MNIMPSEDVVDACFSSQYRSYKEKSDFELDLDDDEDIDEKL